MFSGFTPSEQGTKRTQRTHSKSRKGCGNCKIKRTIQHSERDAIWAATIIFGSIAFYHVDAETPEEAWPLRPDSPLDLNWLWMSDGKQEVWKLSQPLRPDSVSQDSARNYLHFLEAPPMVHLWEALPPILIGLCGLEDTSTVHTNSYYGTASSLAQSVNLDNVLPVSMNFIAFTMNMTLDYKRLLKRKDPCALLLLAYWYAKVCQYPHWWIYGRAAMELPANCMYLERYHRHNTNLQELLIWPKMICGVTPP